MSKFQKSLRLLVLASVAMTLGSATFAQPDLQTIKKQCDVKFPNPAYHSCKQEMRCVADDASCKAKCNALPEVRLVNKQYDACVSEQHAK